VRSNGPVGVIPLNELYAGVAEDLAISQRILADELISDQSFISDLCQHVGQFHGKLLRPAVLLLSAQACGGVRPAHHTLAAVVELVHLATLVHDDVLDESDIRRRAATVNRLWGNERAVLMGDFIYSHAFHLCSALPTTEAARIIGQTAVTVCEGEMMQVANRGNFDLTEAEYLEIIARKTAALVEASCELGARYAGADAATIKHLRTFGNGVGIAFQIIDDLLDLTGDESEVGKSLGRDLCEGEVTLPLIHFLRHAAPDQRRQVVEKMGNEDQHRGRNVASLLNGSPSVVYARDLATEYITAAQHALAQLPASDARDALHAMAGFVLARRR
jgi:octaprenyl-diphosphate synthase